MKRIDNFLNNITMYRLVTYGLAIIAGAAILMSLFGRLSMSPTHMIVSLGFILTGSYVANRILAWIWKIPTNSESWLVTGLILFLILQPGTKDYQFLALGLAGAVSSASKFVIARHGKHIFNPAAVAAAFLSLGKIGAVSWWVGSSALWWVTLIVGLAIVRKTRRFPMVLVFTAVAIAVQLISGGYSGALMRSILISSPLIFLGTIMLTEPATMPPRRPKQMVFAAGIAVLYGTAWNLGPVVIYPEVALLIGNIYAYIVSPKFRWSLRLKEIRRVSERVSDYVFEPDRAMKFLPGQYMEWTMAGVPFDSRGNRRTFTVASSPTESEVHLGVKFYEPSSAYKSHLRQLRPGDMVFASQLGGNFTLKGHEKKKLVFVAGGIGITPFRSMVKYLLDTGQRFDAVLVYLLSDPSEEAYGQEFAAARQLGLRYLPVSSKPGGNVRSAEFNAEFLASQIPDYGERTFYISGPNAMVESTKSYLRDLGVSLRRIKTDHFSGY